MKDIQDIFPNHFDCIIFSSDIGRCFDLFIPWSCSSLEGRGNFLQSSKRNRGSKNFLLPQHCLSTTSPDYTRTKWIKLWSPRFLITFMLLQNSFSFLQGTFFSLKLYGFIWNFFFFANLLTHIWFKVLREIKEVTDHLPKPFSLSPSQT